MAGALVVSRVIGNSNVKMLNQHVPDPNLPLALGKPLFGGSCKGGVLMVHQWLNDHAVVVDISLRVAEAFIPAPDIVLPLSPVIRGRHVSGSTVSNPRVLPKSAYSACKPLWR